jgi:hypothetical protein
MAGIAATTRDGSAGVDLDVRARDVRFRFEVVATAMSALGQEPTLTRETATSAEGQKPTLSVLLRMSVLGQERTMMSERRRKHG